MADADPVTVADAVAVRSTASPERRKDRSADKLRLLPCATAVPRDETGTLGITGDGRAGAWDAGAGEAGEETVTGSHAAGELSTGFAGSAGHCAMPSGRDGWPGVGMGAGVASHAAPRPEPGHGLPPDGSARVGRSSLGLGALDDEDMRPKPLAGAAASAITLRCMNAATSSSGR